MRINKIELPSNELNNILSVLLYRTEIDFNYVDS